MAEPINRVFTNFLDRMLDETAKSAENMAAFKMTLSEMRVELREIKEHVSREADRTVQDVKENRDTIDDVLSRLDSAEEKRQRIEHYKKMSDFLDKLQSPKTYLTIFVSLVVALASLVTGLVVVINKIEPYLQHSKTVQTPIHSPTPDPSHNPKNTP